MLINEISAITLEVVMSAQKDRGSGGGRNNRGYKYSSLRGRVSSLSN